MDHRRFNHGSRSVLNHRHLERFPGDTLFARLARAVCRAQCLPRKELYEAWEVARRVRRRLRGRVVVDLAAGHGLLAYTMLLLDDSSPRAVCVDPNRPGSAATCRGLPRPDPDDPRRRHPDEPPADGLVRVTLPGSC